MMRWLAEFIMRGRFQAVVVALAGSLIPLLALVTPAAIGLVVLRKGWQEGVLVALWVIVVVAGLIKVEGLGSFAAYLSVGAILVACCVASVLRLTVSWSAALAATVAFSILLSLLVSSAAGSPVEGLLELYQPVLEAQPEETREQYATMARALDEQLVMGAIAFSVAIYTLLGVLIARWWQALLFNPGGFQQEFHLLRLGLPLAAVCLLAFCYCEWRGESYFYWQVLIMLPPLFAGLALCHWLVTQLKWGAKALVAVYVGLVIFPPFILLALLLGLTDVWVDYRKRFNLMQQ